MKFVECKSTEIRQALKDKCVILPVGSIEQHGPHLPLHVDMLLAEHLSLQLANKINSVVLPAIPFFCRSLSFSGGGNDFDGNIYVKGHTAIEYIKDILTSLLRNGARQVMILNGHYENEFPIFEAIEQLKEEGQLTCETIAALSWWSVVDESLIRDTFPGKFDGWHAEHASVVETSMVMAIDEGLVNDIRVDNEEPPLNSLLLVTNRYAPLASMGVLNKTSGSSAVAGQQVIDHVVDRLETLYQEKYL
ncbi:creatininase family protein [Vibrio splendidus]|uniref:creatininase family protein n=1 Tax=Vibrio splendidus TaxID=29497 RepID=UPI00148CBAAF|nr:creatininase family protein [Vibrio splendidus]NOJ07822.1 amidohydrolase [Vibrio splendidus]